MSSSFLEHPLALALPERMTDESAWTEHLPFGMTLVALHRPRSIVELGTHRGDSYCAFCQAVRSLALPSRCLAVDTWEGDPQTGFYGPEVLEELRAHHDPRYGDFSRLLRATFDEALAEVPDGSVDLLHVDGLHEHAAVRHDWEAWAPKLSERAVVLFHDTAERGEGFGVHHLWRELAERYPSFELLHGHGLGVLGVGERIDPAVRSLFEADEALAARVRATFMRLGRSLSRDVALRRARAEREEARRRAEAAERENEALAARADQLESARGELESARDELEAVREAGERTAEALREARERAASAEARVEAQQRASRETEEALDAARAAVAQLQAEQGRLQQAVLEAREGAEAEAARAREAASERVRSVEAALAEREARLEVLEAAVDDARAAEAARASELERREALHAVAIEEARGHAAEAEAARDALLTQIEGERAEAARARGELEAERDALRAELERLGRADEALRENARRAHAVTRELELLREDRARVETSVGFRLVSLQRRVMDRLLPVGTRRRAPYVQASSMVGRWLRRPGARPEAPPPTPPPAVPPSSVLVPDETGP
ncbi:MAG TPA: class I SAM-dependent methyltransferase, partial [Sandaracinaceae bacterium LLY-WYZ-13_1]|nr:class I SAM-dependent methyltransferase [Sandaracinaceae bacterium LLY-WYZ-13_1]